MSVRRNRDASARPTRELLPLVGACAAAPVEGADGESWAPSGAAGGALSSWSSADAVRTRGTLAADAGDSTALLDPKSRLNDCMEMPVRPRGGVLSMPASECPDVAVAAPGEAFASDCAVAAE